LGGWFKPLSIDKSLLILNGNVNKDLSVIITPLLPLIFKRGRVEGALVTGDGGYKRGMQSTQNPEEQEILLIVAL
jgi:hypothetical protein